MIVHVGPPENSDSQAETPVRPQLDPIKGAFLASLNHEVRTPLSGIVGMLDLLHETNLDDDQRDYLNAARMCTESLMELLNASLQYSALEAGQYRLDESEFSVKEMLDAAVSQQQSKAAVKHLKLALSVDATLAETMVGDATRIRELLGYLISNAIKFTHSGTVELKASMEQDLLVASVQDTGIGIPADKLAGIFDSFQQGEGGLSRNYPGLGLGLALTRKLATVMGGRIQVESQEGVGSTFTLEVPLRRPVAGLHRSSEGGPLILAVEDNPVGMMVLKRALQKHHLQADYATSGGEALDAVSRRHYDLILMDLQMPDMNGLEATAEIRKLPNYGSVPILALTASCSDQVRQECRAYGMQAFLSKPVDPNELWTTVSRYLHPDTEH